MDQIIVHVNGVEIPIPQLTYEDVEKIIIPAVVGGTTNPIGQLFDWLWERIQGIVGPIRQFVSDLWNTLKDLPKAFGDFVNMVKEKIVGGISTLIDWIKEISSAIRERIVGALDALKKGFDEFGKTLAGIGKSLGDIFTIIRDRVVEGVKGLGEAFKDFLKRLEGVGKALGDIFNMIKENIAKGIDAIGKTLGEFGKALGDIGKTLGSLFETIRKGVVEGIQGLGKTLGDLGKGISDMFSRIRTALTEVGDRLKTGFEAFGKTLGDIGAFIKDKLFDVLARVGQGFKDMIDKVAKFGKDLSDFFSGLQTTISDALGDVYGFFSEIGTTLQGFINSVWEIGSRIWNTLSEFGSKVSEMVTNFINWVAEGLRKGFEALKEITRPIWEPILGFFEGLWAGIQDFAKDPIGWISARLSEAWNALVEFTKPVWEPILGFFEALWAGIQDFARDPLGWIAARISEAWNALVEFTKPIWEPVKNFLDAVWAGIQDFARDPIGWISARISEAWNAFVEFTKPVWEPIQKFFESVWTGIQDFARDPLGWVSARITEAWNAFVEFTKPVWEPIKNFLDGVGAWLQPAFEALGGFASTVVKFFTEDIPKFFTEDVPKFFMEDLPNYVLNGIKFIGGKLQEIADVIMEGLKFIAESILKVCELMADAGRAFADRVISSLFPQAQRAITEALSPHSPPKELSSYINTLQLATIKIIDDTARKLKKHGPVTQEVLMSAGAAAASLATIYALTQTIAMGVEAVYITKNPGLRKIIKSVADNFGGFFIMSALSATYTFFVLHPFLRRYWGKTFRPYLPGPEFFVEALFRKCIDYKYYAEHMAELGYHEDFIQMYIDTHARLLTPEQLIRLMGRGLWDEGRVKLHLQKLGWLGERGLPGPEDILEASWDLPTLENAMEMKWRGYINSDELKKIFLGRGRHPLYWEKEMKTYYKIPSPSDLITFVVRDVIDPDDFKALMKAQGYMTSDLIQEVVGKVVEMPLIGGGYGAGDWADAYWEAHWRLPPMTQVFEFFNRAVVGMISVKGREFKLEADEATKHVFAYATLHDYKPEPRKLTKYLRAATGLEILKISDRDLVEALRYRILTRIESRFVRRWGLVSEDDYKRLAIAQGIDPYIKIKTVDGQDITMIDALVKAEFLQDLLEERTALRTQIINAYVEGFNIKINVYDPIQAKDVQVETLKIEEALKALRFRAEEAKWLATQAIIRRAIELRKDAIKSLIDDYVAGALDQETLTKELASYIDEEEVRNALITLAIKKRARNNIKRKLQRLDRDILREMDTVLRLYENGFTSKTEVEKALDDLVAKEVITADEKKVLMDISERRRKRELVEFAIRALAKRVSRGEITPEQFISEITRLGVDKEFAEKIVEVYVPFHSLSVASLLGYADEVPIPPDLLEKKLRILRVPQDEAEIIKLVAQRRPILDEIRNIGYMLQSLSRDLEVTPSEAMGILSALGLQPSELDLRRKILETLYRYGLRRQFRRTLDVMLREQYQALAKGKDPKLITLDEYIAAYRAMGFPDEYIIARAQEIIASAAQAKLPQFRTTPPAS